MRPRISIWGCVHPLVGPSVRPSVGPPFFLFGLSQLWATLGRICWSTLGLIFIWCESGQNGKMSWERFCNFLMQHWACSEIARPPLTLYPSNSLNINSSYEDALGRATLFIVSIFLSFSFFFFLSLSYVIQRPRQNRGFTPTLWPLPVFICSFAALNCSRKLLWQMYDAFLRIQHRHGTTSSQFAVVDSWGHGIPSQWVKISWW